MSSEGKHKITKQLSHPLPPKKTVGKPKFFFFLEGGAILGRDLWPSPEQILATRLALTGVVIDQQRRALRALFFSFVIAMRFVTYHHKPCDRWN